MKIDLVTELAAKQAEIESLQAQIEKAFESGAQHKWESIKAATIERCAKVAANWEHDHYGTGKGIAAAIRALKTGKNHA